MAPLYPLAFVVIAYAYLGAPRTTRQSRALSMMAAIGGGRGLRLIGFASTVFGVQVPLRARFPICRACSAPSASAGIAISRGVIIEPPAFLSDPIDALTALHRAARQRDVTERRHEQARSRAISGCAS